MNIVYIIGNGFDLNLDLKTRYQDFYKYFIKQSSNEKLVAEMKDILYSETWADLEVALGEYTAKFTSTEKFLKVYFEISDKLAEYIGIEEEKLILSEEKKQKLCNDIIHPEIYLRPDDSKIVAKYEEKWTTYSPWYVNIINFNYSKTIEKILNLKNRETILLGKNRYEKNETLSQIVHIHGVAEKNNTILLGVNDISQIANESFRTDIDILDIFVKPQSNNGIGEGIDADCERFLHYANLICIFGSSIGETDKKWWELLGKQLKRDDCRVICFTREKDIIQGNRKQLLPKKIRECQSLLLSKTNLSSSEQEQVKNKIWVGYNTDMFKLI